MKVPRETFQVYRSDQGQEISALQGIDPCLIVTIDAEEEFDGNAPFSSTNYDVRSMRYQYRAHLVFEEFGIAPTYLVDFPVASQSDGYGPLLDFLQDGTCTIGSQLNPWVNPPFNEDTELKNSFAGNLPPGLERQKIARLTSETHLMNPIGKERQATWLDWTYALMLIPALILAGNYGSIEDIAAARFAVSVVMVPISLTFIGRELGIGPMGFARALWRPALGALVMAAVLSWLDGWLQVPLALDLLISVLLGGATFILVVSIAWLSVGRPVAFETTAIELARDIFTRFTQRWRKPI